VQRKILVTGADGFIGSHLVEHRVRQGHDVRAFVLYNSSNSWGWLDSCAPDVVGQFDVFSVDIRDPYGVRTAMEDCDVVLVIAEIMGVATEVHTQDDRVRPPLSEVDRLWADNRKAKELLGWQPAYGGIKGFRRGLEESVAWFSEPENLAHYKTDVYNV